jgi:hypothetical protein
MRVFHYRLAVGDSGSLDLGAHSVRHVFNGNWEWLQEDASVLFETLQRDVWFERSMGAPVFTTPEIKLDDPGLGHNWRINWHKHAKIIENSLWTYCRDLGLLKVNAMRVSAWTSDGKVRIALPVFPRASGASCMDKC